MDEAVLVAGYRLDRYELLCPIASGGMASVWLARLLGKRGFEKLVAIKTIRTELIKDPRYQEMFLDEARIASGIEHPNVAHIVDLGEQDDNLYIVMEWVDGESLAKILSLVLKRGMTLPLPLSLRLIADACAGLHAAHELRNVHGKSLGIVHRDVSPQNILITTAGTVKVIDFGIAKSRHRGASETQAGTLKGKIRYMAPEQVNGQAIDCRADIWALGMCLGELISGREPFDELSDIEVMRQLMSPQPAPSFDNLQLPDVVRSIFARTLVPEPNRRFESAIAMRRVIESAIETLGRSATSEDVADFVRTNFADLARHRRETISKAVDAADQRMPMSSAAGAAAPGSTMGTTQLSSASSSSASPPSPQVDAALAATAAIPASIAASVAPLEPVVAVVGGKEEIALAPTQIGQRGERQMVTTAGGATLTEQLGPRATTRRGPIAIGVGAFMVIAIVLFSLPGGRLRKLFAGEPPTPTAVESTTTLAGSAPTTPAASAPPPPSPSNADPAPVPTPTDTPTATAAPAAVTAAASAGSKALPAAAGARDASLNAEAFMKGTTADAQAAHVEDPAAAPHPSATAAPAPKEEEKEKPAD